MEIIKISMLGVCGVMLGFFLKNTRPEYASFISMGVGLIILGLAVGKLSYLFSALEKLKSALPLDGSCIAALVKMIGVTYIGQFSAGICKDAGFQAMGAQIELFCRLSVMALCMPVLLALMETIQGFLS